MHLAVVYTDVCQKRLVAEHVDSGLIVEQNPMGVDSSAGLIKDVVVPDGDKSW